MSRGKVPACWFCPCVETKRVMPFRWRKTVITVSGRIGACDAKVVDCSWLSQIDPRGSMSGCRPASQETG